MLAEADIRRKEARKQYLKAKPDVPEMREAFLSECMEILREKCKEEAAHAIQRLLSKAQIRSSWRKIHSLTAKPQTPAVTEVEVSIDGTTVKKTSKDDVESSIIDGVSSRFRSTEGTPLRSGPIAEAAGLLGDTEAAQTILNGTYVPPPGTDNHAVSMLKLLKRLEDVIAAGPIDTTVTKEDFIAHWRRAREDTLSSILGVHFGHYKSATELMYLSKIHALLTHIAAKTG